MRKRFRLIKMGVKTLLGLKKEGYFIPYRYAHEAPSVPAEICYQPIDEKMQKAGRASGSFENIIKQLQDIVPFSPSAEMSPAPRLEQYWFPRLDALTAYNMVTHYKPKNIIEVGSGHSSRFMCQALVDNNITCEFTAIDPSPRATLPTLPNAKICHICDYAQNVSPEKLTHLQANDILFIDSSHILYMGSDVDFLLNRIVPTLQSGVLIHIHDIFLPYDYPELWHWRGYNEQSAVAALLHGQGFEILWSSAYVLKNHQATLQKSGLLNVPIPQGAYESSLWLKKL